MIFVTVGTHEQQFNRLIMCLDDWAEKNEESVFIQTGYCTYVPKHCMWKKMLSYNDMRQYVEDARIVITHGGPASFLLPLQMGKIPVVVPRKKEYGEHVNNHQVDFCNCVAQRQGSIIVINEIDQLAQTIDDYLSIISSMDGKIASNNDRFCRQFSQLAEALIYEK